MASRTQSPQEIGPIAPSRGLPNKALQPGKEQVVADANKRSYDMNQLLAAPANSAAS
jgi:hypothetical protein